MYVCACVHTHRYIQFFCFVCVLICLILCRWHHILHVTLHHFKFPVNIFFLEISSMILVIDLHKALFLQDRYLEVKLLGWRVCIYIFKISTKLTFNKVIFSYPTSMWQYHFLHILEIVIGNVFYFYQSKLPKKINKNLMLWICKTLLLLSLSSHVLH